MIERWLPVAGWKGLYEVSDFGRVRSLPRMTVRSGMRGGRLLSCSTNAAGYPVVMLSARSQGRAPVRRFVHHLVLEAFVGPRPAGATACHSDDPDPTNCRLTNLRWDSHANNIHDKARHGTQTRGEAHSVAKLSEADALAIIRLRGEVTRAELSKRFGISRTQVYRIQTGRRWSHLEHSA